MTIEVAVLISGVSVAFAIYKGVKDQKRADKTETKEDVSQMTTVIVKLETINDGVNEIKAEMTNVKKDVKEQGDKQIRMEESLKSAWKRIDIIEGNKKGDTNE